MAPAELDAALHAVDLANRADPTTVGAQEIEQLGQPLAWIQGLRADAWVQRLDPSAPDELRLAARGHHLRRWTLPRITYPEGRAGYLRWRRDQKARQSDAIAEVLSPLRLPADLVERVQAIITKTDLGADPVVQTFEDAVALTFLETQFHSALCGMEGGPEQMVEVIRKTFAKMTDQGRLLASTLDFRPVMAQIVTDATS